jgi:hypothetical protein
MGCFTWCSPAASAPRCRLKRRSFSSAVKGSNGWQWPLMRQRSAPACAPVSRRTKGAGSRTGAHRQQRGLRRANNRNVACFACAARVAPALYANVAQLDEHVCVFGRALLEVRRGVGEPDQQIGQFNHFRCVLGVPAPDLSQTGQPLLVLARFRLR